jgi:hypothetical protein
MPEIELKKQYSGGLMILPIIYRINIKHIIKFSSLKYIELYKIFSKFKNQVEGFYGFNPSAYSTVLQEIVWGLKYTKISLAGLKIEKYVGI